MGGFKCPVVGPAVRLRAYGQFPRFSPVEAARSRTPWGSTYLATAGWCRSGDSFDAFSIASGQSRAFSDLIRGEPRDAMIPSDTESHRFTRYDKLGSVPSSHSLNASARLR